MCVLKRSFYTVLLILPFVFSLAGAIRSSVILHILSFALLIAAVKLIPAFRYHENIWMFIMTAYSTVPLNLSLIFIGVSYIFSSSDNGMIRLSADIFSYFLLISAEEMIMAGITRRIAPKQKVMTVG